MSNAEAPAGGTAKGSRTDADLISSPQAVLRDGIRPDAVLESAVRRRGTPGGSWNMVKKPSRVAAALLGALIAIPVAAAIDIVLRETVFPRLDRT